MSEKRKPQFDEVDGWGLTHPGKLRASNQDHYFQGALIRGVSVQGTSLATDPSALTYTRPGGQPETLIHRERTATLVVVADGVGSSAGGEHAARVAVEALVKAVSKKAHEAEWAEATDPDVFSRLLQDAALECHESLLEHAVQEPEKGSFSTALTLFLGLWPHAYILQVGDTRAYIYQQDKLTQITRDQTWAQELIDQGTLSQTKAEASRWANVLSSSIGGQETTPVVTRIERDWGAKLLFCSDGLTKHVSDARISELLANMTTARKLAEDLLQEALDGGGTDNITILVGRTLLPQEG